MPQLPLIDIQDATIWRGTTRVFDGLTLRIEQNECVAILGPNGSGKTTLLKALNRELYPVAQKDSWVRILGRDRWNVSELRRHIGVVSDDLHRRYRPTTTAIEVVVSGYLSSIGIHGSLSQRISREQIERGESMLRELNIEALRDIPLKSMSTGQQRRCLLGRAMVHRPSTLIFDEPTAGLDLAASFDYLGRIRRFADDGCTIIIVTHHLNEIPPEVGRIVLLHDGRVAADGCKETVLSASLLSEVYGTPIRIATVDGYFLAYPGS